MNVCEQCTSRPDDYLEWKRWAEEMCNCGHDRGHHAYGHPHTYATRKGEVVCPGFQREISLDEVVEGLRVIVSDLA